MSELEAISRNHYKANQTQKNKNVNNNRVPTQKSNGFRYLFQCSFICSDALDQRHSKWISLICLMRFIDNSQWDSEKKTYLNTFHLSNQIPAIEGHFESFYLNPRLRKLRTSLYKVIISGRKFTFSFKMFPRPVRERAESMVKMRPPL